MSQTIELLCGPNATQLVRSVIQVTPDQFDADFNPKGSWSINGVQAQVEPVSRAWNGCPDTVEVIAVVPVTPNQVINLAVDFRENQPALPSVPMPDFGTLRLECVDFQNRHYSARFSSQDGTVVKDGAYQKITRFAGTFDGVGIKLLGYIAFVTQNVDSNLVDVELFIHNGLAQPVIGNLFFRSLAIYSESNLAFFPKSCSKRPCGRAVSGGYSIAVANSYYWPKQAGLTRRFVVALNETINRKELKYRQEFGGMAFLRNWTDSFGINKTGLGSVTDDLIHYGNNNVTYHGRAALKRQSIEEYNALKGALENGTIAEWVGVYSTPYGPFHPFYLNQQGAVSGFWIYHYAGWKQCYEELAANYLFAAMNVERQPWNVWHAAGTPKTAGDFAQEGNGVIQFDFAPFDFSVNGIPAFIHAGNYNTGDATTELSTFPPHDAQHQCRYLKPLQALAYANDYLAKELLCQAAEVDYLYLNMYPQVPGWSGGHNLAHMLALANAHPRQGGLMGRGRCWPIDGVMGYYHVASQQWRDRVRPWIASMAECLIKSQMPTGWNNRFPGDGGSQVVVVAQLPLQYDVAQTFEVEFEDWIKRALLVALPPQDRLRVGLSRSILRSASSFFDTAVNNDGNYRWFIAVGHNHGLAFTPGELTYSLTSQGGEIFQGWYVLNHAILADREFGGDGSHWIQKSLNYRLHAATTAEKIGQISHLATDSWNDHLPQAIGLMFNLNG